MANQVVAIRVWEDEASDFRWFIAPVDREGQVVEEPFSAISESAARQGAEWHCRQHGVHMENENPNQGQMF